MIVKLLTEHHLEFLSSKGGCRGSSESTLVRMSNCWKSRALAHLCRGYIICIFQFVLPSATLVYFCYAPKGTLGGI